MRPFDHDNAERLSHRLGWISLGIGLAGLFAPRQVAKLIGARPSNDLVRSIRLVAIREMAVGAIIFARPGRAWPIWARVAGDAVDLTLMSQAADDLDARRRLVWATGAAAGLTAVDIGCATSLTTGTNGHAFAARVAHALRRGERSIHREKIMASDQTLRALLTEDIRDLYDAERQLTKALPKFARAANSDQLREALDLHLEETEGQIGQLEEVFEALGEKPQTKHCAGIAGILDEGMDFIHGDYDGAVLDAAIIAMVQRAEHYEITAYGTCIAWAKALRLSNVASMLTAMLDEEKAVDRKLTELAEGGINTDAAAADAEAEEETGIERVSRMTPHTRRPDNGHRRHPHTH